MKVQIKADGGSRGNPGIAGSGTVLYDASGMVLTSIADYVGTATNNVAEYRALLNGLEAARDLGATEVEVLMDSKLVVEQMSGRWKIKHPDMKELALKAQAIARDFDAISYTWIPRAENSEADALANQAMDAGAAGAGLPEALPVPVAAAAGAAARLPTSGTILSSQAAASAWYSKSQSCRSSRRSPPSLANSSSKLLPAPQNMG